MTPPGTAESLSAAQRRILGAWSPTRSLVAGTWERQGSLILRVGEGWWAGWRGGHGLGKRIGMIRRYGIFSPLLLLAFLSIIPHGFSIGSEIVRFANAATAPRNHVANSITIRNASGTVRRDYPFQFGRPFVDGAIANQPQVLINGQPMPTQADV